MSIQADYRAGRAAAEADARAEPGPLPMSPVVPGRSAMWQAGYRAVWAAVRAERAQESRANLRES